MFFPGSLVTGNDGVVGHIGVVLSVKYHQNAWYAEYVVLWSSSSGVNLQDCIIDDIMHV